MTESHYGLNVQQELINHLSHINDKNVEVEIILTYIEPHNRENVEQ